MRRAFMRVIAAAALAWSAGAAPAADFSFTFSSDLTDPNAPGAVDGTVTGRILGLADNGDSSAQAVLIDSYSADGSVGLPIDATQWFIVDQNWFTVEGGEIVGAVFRADNFDPFSLDQLLINVLFDGPFGANYVSLGSNNEVRIWNNQGLGGITFTRLDGAVPEPATWAMMLLGLGAVGVVFRRRPKALAPVKL